MTPSRILVTRPAGQMRRLSGQLRAAGFEAVEVPAIAIAPPASYDDLDRAIAGLDEFDWVLVTSQNAVAALFGRLAVVAPGRTVPRLHWAAVGPGTAAALADRGVTGVWMPSRYLSGAVAEELPARPGERVLRLRAEVAAEIAPTLRARGIVVHEVVAYRTLEAPADSIPGLRRALAEGVEAVVLTSASAARGLLALAAAAGLTDALRTVPAVAIGPVTAAAACAAGLHVSVVSDEHTAGGIARALQRRMADGAGELRHR